MVAIGTSSALECDKCLVCRRRRVLWVVVFPFFLVDSLDCWLSRALARERVEEAKIYIRWKIFYISAEREKRYRARVVVLTMMQPFAMIPIDEAERARSAMWRSRAAPPCGAMEWENVAFKKFLCLLSVVIWLLFIFLIFLSSIPPSKRFIFYYFFVCSDSSLSNIKQNEIFKFQKNFQFSSPRTLLLLSRPFDTWQRGWRKKKKKKKSCIKSFSNVCRSLLVEFQKFLPLFTFNINTFRWKMCWVRSLARGV